MKKLISLLTAFILTIGSIAMSAPDTAPLPILQGLVIKAEAEDIASCFPTPYKTIALKSKTNGCYVTCDIGSKGSNGRYENMDYPIVNVDAQKINSYEMFDIVPCSDNTFALMSIMNKKYLSVVADNSAAAIRTSFCDDFITEKNLRFSVDGTDRYLSVSPLLMIDDEKNGSVTIRFVEQKMWLCVKKNKLHVTASKDEADYFDMEKLSDNSYTAEEMAILSSNEWHDLKSGVGYWDIQQQIGEGKTDALKSLGYYTMYREDQKSERPDTVEIDNMQCAIGVKKLPDDSFDVIITFQGTGGYGDEGDIPLRDLATNMLGNSYTGDNGMHQGYYDMAHKLFSTDLLNGKFGTSYESIIRTNIDGDYITLSQLKDLAKKKEAHFTLLGHSMGGGIAQCYALYLHDNYGIPISQISGRTFNSALAIDFDRDWSDWDWINLCVSTDSVTQGHVPGSIVYYGYHRIGKTVYLYDPSPNTGLDIEPVSNICDNKHVIDHWGTLFTILESIQNNLGNEMFEYRASYNQKGTWAITELKKESPVISIPRRLDGMPVSEIAYEAFKECSYIISATIPDSVTLIGESAFGDCPNLITVNLPDSITSIEKYAFSNCPNLKKITLPSKLTSINDDLFYECESLENIVIPEGVTSIGENVFFGCTGLKSITFPDGLKCIGGYAFTLCKTLDKVILPDSVTSIGPGTFENCDHLKEIKLSNALKCIEDLTFYECTSLKSITIPDNVTSIDYEAFKGCTALESVSLPSKLKSIGYQAFYECESLKKVTIPKGVTSISESAFSNCTSLESVTLPDGITSIDYWAFDCCPKLKQITVPASVTEIGGRAFGYYLKNDDYYKVPGFTIYGYRNTAAEEYANDHGFTFIALDDGKPGDVDGDGDMSIKDVLLLRQSLAGWNVGINSSAADANGDGKVDILDVLIMRQRLAGWAV